MGLVINTDLDDQVYNDEVKKSKTHNQLDCQKTESQIDLLLNLDEKKVERKEKNIQVHHYSPKEEVLLSAKYFTFENTFETKQLLD